jgi:hypothetical protein
MVCCGEEGWTIVKNGTIGRSRMMVAPGPRKRRKLQSQILGHKIDARVPGFISADKHI